MCEHWVILPLPTDPKQRVSNSGRIAGLLVDLEGSIQNHITTNKKNENMNERGIRMKGKRKKHEKLTLRRRKRQDRTQNHGLEKTASDSMLRKAIWLLSVIVSWAGESERVNMRETDRRPSTMEQNPNKPVSEEGEKDEVGTEGGPDGPRSS